MTQAAAFSVTVVGARNSWCAWQERFAANSTCHLATLGFAARVDIDWLLDQKIMLADLGLACLSDAERLPRV